MNAKLGKITRLLLLAAAGGLIVSIFMPIWRIELNAPQYPEGLSLTIHAHGLEGNVDIINGLNHYIGMKTLHNEDFFEFTLLPYCIAFFALAFLTVAIRNKRAWLNILLVLFVSFGILAMVDFWKWEYNYGHNLNPNAAIVVPGMAYQPPLIGFKQLLNFGAYSIPDIGGWLFMAAGAILLACTLLEWRKNKLVKSIRIPLPAPALASFLFILMLGSCTAGPESIVAGRDNCYLCKMGISDLKYGGEVLTKKGKTYKFDDIHCLVSFLNSGMIRKEEIKDSYVADFAGTHTLANVSKSLFLQGEEINGPMNGKTIAFINRDSLLLVKSRLNANMISWEQLLK